MLGRSVKRLLRGEVRKMGLVITPENNVYLRRLRDEWIREGREEGLKEGLERGKKEGLKEGLERGLEKARRELVLNVYRNTGLSAEEIARMLSLPEEFVKEVLGKN